MFEMRYPAEIPQHRKGKDWVVKFPDLKGANTAPIRLKARWMKPPTAWVRISPCLS